jgi:hypothetical protein
LRPLSNIPHCWQKPGPYLSPSVADHPLRSTKDHRLGRLLPYQLPNPTQAHLKAMIYLWLFGIFLFLNFERLKKIIPNLKADSYVLRTRTLCFINIQLACVKYIASVHPEPGSNSNKLQFCISTNIEIIRKSIKLSTYVKTNKLKKYFKPSRKTNFFCFSF